MKNRIISLTIFFLGVLIAGLSFFFLYPYLLSLNWNSVPCKIRSFDPILYIDNSQYRGTLIGANITIKYEYLVNGESYASEDIVNLRFEDESSMQRFFASNITVLYNPVEPSQSKLTVNTPFAPIFFFILGLLFIFIPLINRIISSYKKRFF